MAIGRVNTGGGGTGGELIINAPAGVTVIAVNSATEKTYTKTTNSSGVAVFKGLPEGGYNVHIEQGSNETEPITVTVAYKSSATIAWFAATINVTYPAGSTCTCTKGNTTFTAVGTSGSYTFTVPSTGTWTVSCTNGDKSKSKDVSITADGESKSVALGYEVYLYNEGDECTALTGGWTGSVGGTNAATWATNTTEILVGTRLVAGGTATVWANNRIDMSAIGTLFFDVSVDTDNFAVAGVNNNTSPYDSDGYYLLNNHTNKFTAYAIPSSGRNIVSVDVSALSGTYWVELSVGAGNSSGYTYAYIHKVWIE